MTDEFLPSEEELADIKDLIESEPEIMDKKDVRDMKKTVSTVVDALEKDKDYAFARDKIRSVVETGEEALMDLISIAKDSQHPRAFEVLTQMIHTIVYANKQLMEVNKDKKELDSESFPKEGGVTNNNLFIGSTAQLDKLIKNMNSDEDV